MTLLYSLISGLMFRIRGGLKVPFLNRKFPLNKWWFAAWFASLACILKGWNLNFWLVMLIASRLSTQLCGFGEYKGCVLGVGKPNSERFDMYEVDDFLDHFEYKGWKMTDRPIIFGWTGLSIRGLYLTFIIGLALNSIPFMFCGFAWGTICYLCGLFARRVLKKFDKTGWNIDEYCIGGYLSLCLTFLI